MPLSLCTLSDGTRLAYLDEGRGIPLVLVHGFPFDHTMWQGQWAALAGRCRVLAPDLRGFGRSGVTPGTVTMERFADDLAEMLQAADVREPVVLGGLSMGGYIVLAFWRKYASRVRALVLCDTRAEADTPAGAEGRRETADRVEREGAEWLAQAMPGRVFSPNTLAAEPQRIEACREVIRRLPPAGIAAASRGMAQRADSTELLGGITVPTLVVVGEDDAISPPGDMVALAGRLPSARCVRVPRAGHMAPLENPEVVNQAIVELLAALEQ